MKKNYLTIAAFVLLSLFVTQGCVEHRYYRDNQKQSERYEQRHHKRTSRGINVDIH